MNKIVTVIFLITDQQVIVLWKKISRDHSWNLIECIMNSYISIHSQLKPPE